MIFSLAAATCSARGLFHPQRLVADQVEFRHWRDYFDHTAFTSQFLAREHLWQFGNKELSNAPTPLYHYGSYLFPAALASFSRLSSYDATLSLWTPLGTFLTGLAAYTLAAAFGGRSAGPAALIALLVLPDASYYGFHNAWFSYHWLQQIASAGMYGSATAALALLFLLEARRTRSRIAILAGGLCAAATFFFKAQIFVVLLPFLVAWSILCYPRFSVTWRLVLLAAVIVVALGGIVVSNRLHLGPRIAPNRAYFAEYCRGMAAEVKPGVLRTLVEYGAADGWGYYLAAVTLVMLSTFGALLGVVPFLSLWAWQTRKLHPVDLAPWLVPLVYVVLLVGLNDSVVGVNSAELIHRPFVWAYFVVLVWCAGKGCVLLGATRLGRWCRNPKVACTAGLLLLPLPWHMGLDAQQGRLKSVAVAELRPLLPARGLVECGRYVARTGSRSDLVQDTRYDGHLVFGSMAERASYLARPLLWKKSKNPAVPAEIERRYALLEKFKTLTTTAQIQEVAARTGIRWYLVHPDDHLPWPPEILDHPAFRAEGFAVYDLTQSIADSRALCVAWSLGGPRARGASQG